MSKYPEQFDHMMAAWNETEAGRVREHLERALSPAIRFVDPSIDLTGLDAFEANVHAVQARLPGASYKRSSGIDSHNGFFRYHWEIHQDGKLVLPGFEVAQTDESGQVLLVIGFFGPVPEL